MKEKYFFSEYTVSAKLPFSIQTQVLNGDIHGHTHDCTELVIVFQGTAMHKVDQDNYPLRPGDIFVINEKVSHGYAGAHQLNIINIMFDISDFLHLVPEIKLLPGFQSMFFLEPYLRSQHHFESKLQLNMLEMHFVRYLTDLMVQEYHFKNEGYETILQTYFHTLAAYLSRSYSEESSKMSGKLQKLAESVTYIEKNYLSDISIHQLSGIAYLSTRQYSRIFSNVYKMSPKEYIIQLRLDHACNLIKKSSFTISRIAMLSGFSDISFFSRTFKKAKGISPNGYRKQNASSEVSLSDNTRFSELERRQPGHAFKS